MKKRALSLLMSFVLLITLLPATARAADDTITVQMTVYDQGQLAKDKDGKPMLQRSVTVSDLDDDGKYTLDEAFKAAHTAYYTAGAEGYDASSGWMSKFWGDESGAFGYYVNDASANGTSDEIQSGDRITAFIYYDQTGYSDRYAFFDKQSLTAAVGEEFELTLAWSGYDEYWSPVTGAAVIGAPLGVFNAESGAYAASDKLRGEHLFGEIYSNASTGLGGKVKCSFTQPGIYYLTAEYNNSGYTTYNLDMSVRYNYLVPPLCVVTVGTEAERANYQVVQDAKAMLTWASVSAEPQTAVTVAPTLPSSLTVGDGVDAKTVTIGWTSTNSALSIYGGYAYIDRPAAQDVTGKLTATLTYTPEGEGSTPVTDTVEFSVTVKAEGVNADKQSVVSFKELMDNIAASYPSSTDAWTVLDMAAYGQNIKGANYGYSSAAPTLLAQCALGEEASVPNELKTFDVNGAYAIYTTPYVLLGYDATEAVEDNTFTNTRAGMKSAMVSYLNALDTNYAGVDEVTPILAALAPYYGKGESDLDTAVSAGIAWLSAQQNSDGTFSYYGTSNANSTALTVVALSALGIDAHRDSRFIKDGHSALEGLMSFALSTKDGFGYKGNVTKNALSTEQGFRALVSYARFVESGGKAYNIYLDAQAGKAAPADPQITATVKPTPITPSDENTTVTVRVTVSGDTGVWLTASISAQSGVSVYDVLTSVLSANGYTWEGTSGYISYITHPNGTRFGEFSTGENSGWLYKVNGTLPSVGIGDYVISDGDRIVFYYTNDWTRDPSAGSMAAPKQESSTLTPSAAVSNGTASVSVSAKDMSGALGAAEKNGEDIVTITPTLKRSADTITVALPVSAAQQAAEQGVQLVIETETARVTLSAETLSALTGNGNGTLKIEISVKNTEELSNTLTSESLEDAAVVEVTVTADGEKITTFGGKTLTVDIPVDSAQFREGGHFRVFIISGDGTVEQTEGVCEEKNGTLTVRVETTHLSTFVVLPEAILPFADVGANAWYYAAARFAFEHGLMTGVADGLFAPDGTATRAQLVTILWRLAGCPAADDLMLFTDVDGDAWYAEAVRWAASEGIITGYTDGRFDPDGVFTREQLAVMLYRYAQRQGASDGALSSLLRYDDAGKVSAWAAEAVRWCVMRALITGTTGTTLSPEETASRAQLAIVLQRFCTLSDEPGSSVSRAYDGAAVYLTDAVPAPGVGSIGGEWTVLALARGGSDFDAGSYLASLEKTLRESGGVLSERKYTEYSRVILALTALGEDARSFAGYDLTLPLGDFEKTTAQGVNGAIFALLALDSGDYPIPQNADAAVQATRQMYVDAILAAQAADGGWSFSGGSTDADLTAMALQALAEYRGQESVDAAIDRALACLSAMQRADGGFASDGVANAESCAQVLLALCALEIDADDARFTKNGATALDALLSYQTADGGFRHITGGDTNLMASEQAACALAALVRVENGTSGFYTMNDTAARLAA